MIADFLIADFGLLIIEAELMEEKLLMDLKNDVNEILFMIADLYFGGSLSECVGDLKPRDKIKENKKHRNLLN